MSMGFEDSDELLEAFLSQEGEEALDVFSPGERKLLASSGICFRSRLLDLLRRLFRSGR